MEILNKITMRSIMGTDVKPFLTGHDQVDLAQIIGFAVGETKGDRPTAYGDNIWLDGEFKAKNLINGNMFYAPKLYCPEVMHNIISNQLKGSPGTRVMFAFVVGIKISKINIGYEYTVRSLIEPKEDNNPFSLIENQMKPTGQVVSPTSTGDNHDDFMNNDLSGGKAS